jgi:alpha-tubulin suppressor-like RCC1 family protein
MTRFFRHFAALLLFALACGRSELDSQLPFEGQGGRSANHGGASATSNGGSPARGGAVTSTGGAFSTSGTFGIGGTFGTSGTTAIAGTFGTGGTFPIAGALAVGGTENNDAGAPGTAGANDAGDRSVVQVAAGLFHVCVLGDRDSVKCWGAGDHGALGYGNSDALGDNEQLSSIPDVWVTNDPSARVSQVVAGGYHTCVRFVDGTAKCWGENSDGQLGYGDAKQTRGSVAVPAAFGTIAVSESPNVTVETLCAGEKHTCALLSDLTVKCWGSNASGQLGYGTSARVGAELTPSEVGPVSLANHVGVSDVSCGAHHTCALLNNGTVQCWGANQAGQLGLGSTAMIGDDEKPDSVPPVSVTSELGVMVKRIAAGDSHTCALLTDLSVHCWGFGSVLGIQASDNVGDTELPSSVAPVELTVAGEGELPVDVKAGRFHTCVLFDHGSLKCWGRNDFGELGQGNLDTIGVENDPADVGMLGISDVVSGTGVSAFVPGNYLTCAAVRALHELDPASFYCWGWNEYGQLGRGNTFTIGDYELPTSPGPLKLF